MKEFSVLYLVKSNPVPGASGVIGCHLKFGHSISHFPPFIFYNQGHQRDVHFIWELWRAVCITVTWFWTLNHSFPHWPQPQIYLQGEDRGDGLVVAHSVLHVTAVEVLCYSSAAGEAGHRATLRCAACWSHGSYTPQNAISPCRLTLFPTRKEIWMMLQIITYESKYIKIKMVNMLFCTFVRWIVSFGCFCLRVWLFQLQNKLISSQDHFKYWSLWMCWTVSIFIQFNLMLLRTEIYITGICQMLLSSLYQWIHWNWATRSWINSTTSLKLG